MTVDLSSFATDLTSIGLPGYFGIRVDCAAADSAALALAANQNYTPVVVPSGGDPPAVGQSALSPPSDPNRVYVMVVYVGGDPGAPLGDGQPNWPNSAVKSNAAVSARLIGVIDGVPIDGF